MKTLILGVDPGLSGAWALLEPGDESTPELGASRIVEIIDTPVHMIEGKKFLDFYGLSLWLETHAHRIKLAMIEEVSSGPRDGRQSAFRFGESYGAAQQAVSNYLIPVRYVRPAKWKKTMRLTSDKEDSRRLATQIWPEGARDWWPNKGHDGRAEAALLALYAHEMGLQR